MRFSLRILLCTVAVVCASTVGFGLAGFVLATVGLLVAAYIAASESKWHAVTMVGIGFLFVSVLLALLLPMICFAREPARRYMCKNNLKQISLALRSYHRDHGSFPPAYIADQDGKPMHSWRVLILPYLGEKRLYARYRFSEPWNSPNNSKLVVLRPAVYVCPSDRRAARSAAVANYLAVVGPRTVWPHSKGCRQDDIGDRPSETIQVVEVADSGIGWMEPRDLSFDQALLGINPELGLGISSRHGQHTDLLFREVGANVIFVGFNVGFLAGDLPKATIEALLTANGGETVAPSVFDARRPDRLRCFSLVVVAASIAILTGWPWAKRRMARSHFLLGGGADLH